jgi:hypothetical protein
LVASPLKRSVSRPQSQLRRPLALIEGSLSARKVVRQAPWLAGLHRLTDGALLGLGVSMLALSGLTLHWQSQWGRSYQALEATQVLEHRLQESAALLEQHHLGAIRKPGWLVPTSSEQLVHLSPPPAAGAGLPSPLAIDHIHWGQIAPGY